MNSGGTQPYIYMYPLSPKLSSHLGCHRTLSRVSCAIGRSLLVIHFKHSSVYICSSGFPGGSVVKNPLANTGDLGLIPGSGRSFGGGNATHSSIFAWEIPWAERSLVGYSSWGGKRVRRNLAS